MLRKASTLAARWLAEEGAITQEQQAIYAYALFSLVWGLLPLIIMAALGWALGLLYEGFLLLLPYMLLRKLSGGFHFASAAVCFVFSTAILWVTLVLTDIVIQSVAPTAFAGVTVLPVLLICLCSPIDSEARRLDKKERQVFRRLSRVFSILIYLVCLGLLLAGDVRSAIPVGMGLHLTASLQLPCLPGMAGAKKTKKI